MTDKSRIRIDFAYDGTHFYGWAKQPGLRTVQSELERALALVLRNEELTLTVGGRTDAGVHARGQVCNLDVPTEKAEKLTARKLNGVLKRYDATDIVVKSVAIVSQEFDARFSAISRRYEYRMLPGSVPVDPLSRLYTAALKEEIDLKLLNETSDALLGLRDFATFCKQREGATTVRTLEEFAWVEEPDGTLVGRIKADAFCHSMVRALVGGVISVASGRLSLPQFLALVEAKQRTSSLHVMPAHGLSLEEIIYPSPEEYAQRANATRAKRK